MCCSLRRRQELTETGLKTLRSDIRRMQALVERSRMPNMLGCETSKAVVTGPETARVGKVSSQQLECSRGELPLPVRYRNDQFACC